MYGIEQFTAIINPPQAAILTVGMLEKKPAVDDQGKVVAREQMTLTLVCDHRILYGADGAEFLARVRSCSSSPSRSRSNPAVGRTRPIRALQVGPSRQHGFRGTKG